MPGSAWRLCANTGHTAEEWRQFIFSDECPVERGTGKARAWVFRTPRRKCDPPSPVVSAAPYETLHAVAVRGRIRCEPAGLVGDAAEWWDLEGRGIAFHGRFGCGLDCVEVSARFAPNRRVVQIAARRGEDVALRHSIFTDNDAKGGRGWDVVVVERGEGKMRRRVSVVGDRGFCYPVRDPYSSQIGMSMGYPQKIANERPSLLKKG